MTQKLWSRNEHFHASDSEGSLSGQW